MRKNYSCITIPEELFTLIDKAIEGKGFSSRAEYIKYLIRKDNEGILQ